MGDGVESMDNILFWQPSGTYGWFVFCLGVLRLLVFNTCTGLLNLTVSKMATTGIDITVR